MKKVEIKLTFTCDDEFFNGPMEKFKQDIESGTFTNDILEVQNENGLEDFGVTFNEIQEDE